MAIRMRTKTILDSTSSRRVTIMIPRWAYTTACLIATPKLSWFDSLGCKEDNLRESSLGWSFKA